MDIFMRIIATIIGIYCIVAIIYSVQQFFKKNKEKRIKKRLKRYILKSKHKKCSKARKRYIIKRNFNRINILLKRYLHIKNIKSLEFYLYGIAAAYIADSPYFFDKVFIVNIINYTCISIFLIAIGRVLYFNKKNNYVFFIAKLLIFVIYSSLFIVIYLNKPENRYIMFISLFLAITYSILFLLSIINEFKSLILLLISSVIVYIYNLTIIGIDMGYYYFIHNDIYNLFSSTYYNYVYNNVNIKSLLMLIISGLRYSYTTTSGIITSESVFINSLPLLQYIYTTIINLIIVSFLVSCIASKFNANKHDLNEINNS